MTVTNSSNKITYIGNGLTTQFPFTFKIFKTSDIQVTLTDTLTGIDTKLTTNYSVNMSGYVVYPVSGSPLTSTTKLTINRVVPITQDTTLPNQGAYFAKVVETALDKVTVIEQQLASDIDRTMKFSVSLPDNFNRELPAPVALKALRINSDATGFEYTMDPESSAIISEAAKIAAQQAQAAAELAKSQAESLALQDFTGIMKVYDIISKGPRVDIRSFGAIGDGITDNTIAIQSAIDYAMSTSRNLYAPQGKYLISNTLNIITKTVNSDGLKIFGDGMNCTIFSSNSDAPIFNFDGNGDNQTTTENIRIQADSGLFDMQICDSEYTLSRTNQIGVRIRGLHRFVYKNLFINTVGGAGIKSFGVTGMVNIDTDALVGVYGENLRIRFTGAEGVRLTANRGGIYHMQNTIVENTTGNGIMLAGSSIKLDTVSSSMCGRVSTQTGGVKICRCDDSGLVSKNIILQNIYYEGNAFFDLDLTDTYGFTINGSEHAPLVVSENSVSLIHPTTAFMQIGESTIGGYGANYGKINNVIINGFPDETKPNVVSIIGVKIGQYASDIDIGEVISFSQNSVFPVERVLSIENSSKSIIESKKTNIKAYATFNGVTGVIKSSYNISTVTRNSAGNYTVVFARGMLTDTYNVLVTCGSVGVLGAFRLGGYSDKNATTVGVYTINPATSDFSDADDISITVL